MYMFVDTVSNDVEASLGLMGGARSFDTAYQICILSRSKAEGGRLCWQISLEANNW